MIEVARSWLKSFRPHRSGKRVADLRLGNSQPQPTAVQLPHDRPDEAYVEAIGVALRCGQFNAAIDRG
jgi:hypothetical protein